MIRLAAGGLATVALALASLDAPAPRNDATRDDTGVALREPLPESALAALTDAVDSLQQRHAFTAEVPVARVLIAQHALRDGVTPEMLTDFARLLSDAALEARPSGPRGSAERIALGREALASCERAAELARTPRERAEALSLDGHVCEVWGFATEAAAARRAAAGVDPAWIDPWRREGEPVTGAPAPGR